MQIAKNSGVDLSFIYDKPIIIIFKDLQSITGKRGILGRAKGSDDDDRVEIFIDQRNWAMLSDLERTTTMYHELSHDILNAAHVEDESHLMHPTYQFTSITELVVAMSDIFKKYKDNTLQQF